MTRRLAGSGGGGKSGGGEARTPVEAPDTLRSVAYARILDAITEGEAVGLENGMQDIYLDETPLQNADLSFNFKNVQVESRTGTQDQEPIAAFPEVESETAVGVLLETTTPYTHAFTNLDLTGLRVRLSVAALSSADVTTGDVSGYEIEYAIDLATDGGAYTEIFAGSFSGKASSPFERSHAIDLPPATITGWLLRVRRITLESASLAIQDEMSVVSYTELIQANLRYPNTALVGIIVDASQFRSIPSRAYWMKGRIIRVPANYDPVTRVYAVVGVGTSGGIWDGTFKLAWTDNPAWIYYDMASHFRYGMGHLITDAQLNKWALYTIAQYCDELVDDGIGGTEPRFTCNIYLQRSEDAYQVLQDLASVFRGLSYWAGGMINSVADMPADPVYTYTNSNVIDGLFTYSGTSRQARHTTALVAWSDPQDFGRGKIEYVMDDVGIERFGVRPVNITAIGATTQGQAHRVGLWALLSERLEPGTVVFKIGLDGVMSAPGQFVRIADQYRAGVRNGGRVRTATTSVITLDAMPAVDVGDTLTCILPTGLAQTRTVSVVGVDALTVSVAYDAVPVVGSGWVVESVDLEAQLYRVVGVAEEDGIIHSLICLQKNLDKFDAVDFSYSISTPNTSIVPAKVIAPPAAVTVTSYEKVSANLPNVVAVAEWDAIANAIAYEVAFRRDSGDWTPTVRVLANRYEMENAAPGEYVARVITEGYGGVRSLQRLSAATAIGNAAFTQKVEVAAVAGVVTFDCAVSEQFKTTLTGNVTFAFINVANEKTLVVDVYNTGSYTVTLPGSVTSFTPAATYVATTGGTVPAPKHDAIGFKTTDAGVSWAARYDRDI